jgi:hypothetical protein
MWDYILSGIDEKDRCLLKEQGKSFNLYQDDSYFLSHSDLLVNLDYVCLAMLQYQRPKIMDGDYIDCLKIAMTPSKLDCAQDIIKIAERVRKIIYERQVKQHAIVDKDTFPRLLEKDVEHFMQQYSLSNSLNETNIGSHNGSIISPKKCYLVKEEESENEDSEEENEVANLSSDNLQKLEEVQEVHNMQKHRMSARSSMVDGEEEKFMDCISQEGDQLNESELNVTANDGSQMDESS